MKRVVAGGLIVALVALVAGAAEAQPVGTTVTGGGLSRACAEAAKNGESAFRFEKICTNALETERLIAQDRAVTFVNRGIIRLRRANYDQAIADFNIALRYKPELAEAYVNRGAAAIGVRHFAESVTDINRALALGVQRQEKAYYNRGLAYEGLDDLGAAYRDYSRALELAPDWDLAKQQLVQLTGGRTGHPPQVAAPQS
jgi:tetratricopeptide (TPR) repeat protein